jgi:DNA-3-methyladenine glycosylase
VAKNLVGCRLVLVRNARRVSGVIVETEAYRGSKDPASHAYGGKTPRNSVMFGPPGHAYVYFTMGMHYCLNVTTEAVGVPAAVLLRALRPVEGADVMGANRGVDDPRRLASGPGNLTKALGIDGRLNGEDMTRSDILFLEPGIPLGPIGVSTRVGISVGKKKRWRYYLKGDPCVSRGRPS